MKDIEQIFRLESTIKNRRSAVPIPMGVKTTPSEGRAELNELESAYITDATVNNGVNKAVAIMMSADRTIIGNEESVSVTEEFLDSIGTSGGNTEWERLLELTLKHQCIYGRAFNELIYNADQSQLLDLDFIDPKKIDYAKNNVEKIVLDPFSNPVGWVEGIPPSEILDTSKLRSDTPPKEVDVHGGIFFKPDRIAHYKLYEVGDGFYGIGMIEPILKPSQWKGTMMEAITNVYYRAGFPVRIFKVGDPLHEPTPELLERTSEELQKASYKSSFAIPNYVDPIIMEAKKADKLKEHLKFFEDEEIMTLGPKAFVTGSGEATNKAVLSRMEFLYKLTLRDIINRTRSTIEKRIFAKLSELNNLPDVPKIIWGEINLEELDSKADRLVSYVQAGLLTPDKNIEGLIRKYEGLPDMTGGKPNVRKEKKQ